MGFFMACSLFRYFRETKTKINQMGGTCGTIAGEGKFDLVVKTDTDHLENFLIHEGNIKMDVKETEWRVHELDFLVGRMNSVVNL